MEFRAGTRRVTTENSIYLITEDPAPGMWGYFVRLPRDEKPRLSWGRLLTDHIPHPLAAWGLDRGVWAPGVLALRLWAPTSIVGVYTSPVMAIDDTDTGPIPPRSETRTGAEVIVLLSSSDYEPDWVEFHGTVPGTSPEDDA
ncbi:MAG TPA: hypothetical protein VFP54_05960 [Acidimicrobiales bacterium]|nr:hypothetical protein [Acidimicrobiales bacterium]